MNQIKFLKLIVLIIFSAQKLCLAQETIKVTELSTNKEYGFVDNPKLAVKVGTIDNEYTYLNFLQGPTGETIRYFRIASCCPFESKNSAFPVCFLDKWQITYDGLSEPIILYLNGYEYDDPKCPMGLTIKTSESLQKIQTDEGEIVAVSPCDPEKIYAVDDFLLLEKLNEDLNQAEKNPEFEGGSKQLKKYFKANTLQDEEAKDLIFRVSIAFVVNCEGMAGNFQIVTKGKGDLETFAKQVMEIVSKMPQKWTAASKNNKAVDCYQVISFTVSDGKLEQFSYY